MNKISLIGRIASIKHVNKKGTDVLTYQVVVEEKYKDKEGNWQSIVSNFFATMFGKRAGALFESKYFKKGHLVSVQATVRSKQYEVDGETRYGYDFIIDDIQLLSRTLDEMIASREQYQGQGHSGNIPDDDYDIDNEGTGNTIAKSAGNAKSKSTGKTKGIPKVVNKVDDDCPFGA